MYRATRTSFHPYYTTFPTFCQEPHKTYGPKTTNAVLAACEARCKTEKPPVKWKSHEMENPPGPLPPHNRPLPLLSYQSPNLLYVTPMRGSTDYGKTVGKQERDDMKMQNGSAESAHIPPWIHSANAWRVRMGPESFPGNLDGPCKL